MPRIDQEIAHSRMTTEKPNFVQPSSRPRSSQRNCQKPGST
jgi:hypothetical protein